MTNAMLDFTETSIEEWVPENMSSDCVQSDIEMLGEVLHAVVHAGAGVSFCVPFSHEDAVRFWQLKVLPCVLAHKRRMLVARASGRIVGTVHLDLDVSANGQHRAEVLKMLVHPSARRRGIARALMTALEDVARSETRSLLVLDTVTDCPAEAMYTSLGYVSVGVIPRYARGSLTPELQSATIMYKELDARPN